MIVDEGFIVRASAPYQLFDLRIARTLMAVSAENNDQLNAIQTNLYIELIIDWYI